jgi:hypothetical protein
MASRKDGILHKAITTMLAWQESMTWMLAGAFFQHLFI